MYFTSGSDRAFEQLMQTRPGADHFDSGEAGAPEDCGTCRFYRPHWKYQFCVYEECPYQPGKRTALDGAVKFQVKGVDDEMAVFRVEKNRGYTVMSNHHLRNKDLSLKAKGLLSQMLSLPEDWDFTLKGLSLINREQIDAIRAAVRELEQAGYIVRSRERDSQGRLRGADYIIYEQPQPVPDSPTLENPTLDNPTQEKPTQEKPTQLNKDRSSKDKSITDGSNTDSIPILDNNILLTQTERLTMNNRPKDPKTARNKNVLVIGGSGSGKTRFFVKPNLMQCVSKDYPTSFVITDPKGSLIGEVGQLLVRCGYRVKVLNTINFSKSMRYNPFRYIHSEKDILKLVNTLICNTKGEGEKSAEDFWIKSERLLYSALIGYIWYEAPDDEMNFTTLLEMINASEAREDDPEFQSPVDQMFERLEEKDPEHFAVRQYRKFLLSAGKTRSSILISCGARLAPFDIREVRELMEDDELELDTIGDKKTALFLIMSDTDTTFNFILAMVQSQLINLLCDRADDKYGGRLPVHVRLILDEFANIGQIPNFDKLIATIRSREISASIILQSQSQLKAIYKDAAEIISDNCDCTLFLSGRGKNAKEIAEVLGKETIDSYNQSENRGAQTSHGLNYQKLGKELMSQDEIATMDGGKCILQVRGVRPFFSEKYDITRHPRYKYLSDADKKNTFDVDSYLSSLRRKRRRVVTEDEPFDLYDIELSDEDFAAE